MALAAPRAQAAPKVRFRVDAKPYAEALIDLALQADISLLGASACGGVSPRPLVGDYTVEAALGKLLEGAPCGWRLLSPGAVQIVPLVQAQAADPPVRTVGEVLVTATKRVQSSQHLAASVSVISRRQLAISGAIDPGESSGQLAGVLTTDLGPARDKILLRGLSDGAFTGRSRSTVGTYLDNTPLNYNAPDPDLRLVDVEQVEVVRGPQGALYGGGSLSGVYRIVTRKPDTGRFSAETRATGSLTRSGDPGHAVEGYANLPVLRGRIGLRLSAYHEVQGGYLDDFVLGRKNVDRTDRVGGRLAIGARVLDNWSLDIAAAVQHLRSDDTHYTITGLDLLRGHRVAEPHRNDIGLVNATLRGAWSWGELTASTGYVQHVYSSLYDASRVVDLFTSRGGGVGVYREKTSTEMLVQDVVLTSRGAGPVGWLAGVYASTTFENSPSYLLAGVDPDFIEVYSDARRDRIVEFAAYGEASYEFLPDWTVALGARLFRTEVKTRSAVISELASPRALNRRAVFDGFSPKITLQRDLDGGDSVYAVFSEGHRPGGVNSGGGAAGAAVQETFGQDQLLNFEIGGRKSALDRRLSLHGAAFYDVWRNIQTDQFRSSGIPYTANVGDAAIAGLEGEATFVHPIGLTLGVNTLITHTRILRTNPLFARQITGTLPSAPELSGGVLATYERPLSSGISLRLAGQVNYIGRSRVSFDPTLSNQMGDFLRTRLSTALAGRGWEAELFVTNALDNISNTFAFGNPFTFLQARQLTPQRPVTVGLTLSAAR